MQSTPSVVLLFQIWIFSTITETSAHYNTKLKEPSYHEPVVNPPLDLCGYMDPEFPYAISKLSGYRRMLTIVHGGIMVWIFIFFIPISIFPVLWHRIGPNEPTGKQQMRQWMRTHVNLTNPIYPLMTVSVVCAMVADYDNYRVLKNSKCTFYNQSHELLGTVCFLVYTFQFFMGFFIYESLLNDVYRSLRFYHSLSNCFGYILSIPLMAMARVSTKEGAKRYLYIVPYLFFFFYQVNVNIRMKIADFGALQWHMAKEAEIANDNKGIMLRTSQWFWNFGFPSNGHDSHLIDLQTQRSTSRIRLPQYLKTYTYYWRRSIVVSLVISILMTAHLGLLYSGIYLSSANYFPEWHTLGDFAVDWSLLKVYAL